jgi:hypothetical protein
MKQMPLYSLTGQELRAYSCLFPTRQWAESPLHVEMPHIHVLWKMLNQRINITSNTTTTKTLIPIELGWAKNETQSKIIEIIDPEKHQI